jgi:hypothetical protein
VIVKEISPDSIIAELKARRLVDERPVADYT